MPAVTGTRNAPAQRAQRAVWAQGIAGVQGSQLLTELAGKDALPKGAQVYEQPDTRRELLGANPGNILNRTLVVALVLTTLAGKDVLPSGHQLTPEPVHTRLLRGAAPGLVDNRTHISQGLLTTLRGKDALPVGTQPIPEPRNYREGRGANPGPLEDRTWLWNLQQTTLAPVVTTTLPTGQQLLPDRVPGKPPGLVDNRTLAVSLLTTTLAPQGPGVQVYPATVTAAPPREARLGLTVHGEPVPLQGADVLTAGVPIYPERVPGPPPRERPLTWTASGEPLLLEGADTLPVGEQRLPERAPPPPPEPRPRESNLGRVVVEEPLPLRGLDQLPSGVQELPERVPGPEEPYRPGAVWFGLPVPLQGTDRLPVGESLQPDRVPGYLPGPIENRTLTVNLRQRPEAAAALTLTLQTDRRVYPDRLPGYPPGPLENRTIIVSLVPGARPDAAPEVPPVQEAAPQLGGGSYVRQRAGERVTGQGRLFLPSPLRGRGQGTVVLPIAGEGALWLPSLRGHAAGALVYPAAGPLFLPGPVSGAGSGILKVRAAAPFSLPSATTPLRLVRGAGRLVLPVLRAQPAGVGHVADQFVLPLLTMRADGTVDDEWEARLLLGLSETDGPLDEAEVLRLLQLGEG